MTATAGNAPAWLFAFVDLAFLLLLGLTQLQSSQAADLGEIVVPRIGAERSETLAPGSKQRWQLRVHPPSAEAPEPFELVDGEGRALRVSTQELRERLATLGKAETRRPLLAPHADARSEDLLRAVAWIEENWPGRRRATVRWDTKR